MRCRERIASAARRPSGDHVQFIGQPSSAWRRASPVRCGVSCATCTVVQCTQTVTGVLLVAAGVCPDNAHSARSCAPPALPLLASHRHAHEERTRTSNARNRANEPTPHRRAFRHSDSRTHARSIRCRWAGGQRCALITCCRSQNCFSGGDGVMRRDWPLYSYWLPPCTRARALPHWSPRRSSSSPSEGR